LYLCYCFVTDLSLFCHEIVAVPQRNRRGHGLGGVAEKRAMRSNVSNIVLLGAGATLLFTKSAWAYLDPGTGSMMLQLLLGGIAGAMVVGKLYWHRFRQFVTSRFAGKSTRASASLRTDAPDE
jgi:hypothetical protein